MRAGIFVAFFAAAVLCMAGPSLAAPAINSVSYTPDSSIWVGEALAMSVNCTDSGTVSSVVAQMSGSNGYVIPNHTMSLSSGLYQATVSTLYLTSPGNFSALFHCTNSLGQQTTYASSFTLSNLTLSIASVSPSTIYVGNQIEFDVLVKRNGTELTSGVSFSVLVDGSSVSPVVTPPYDPSKGWVVYMPAQTASGSYAYRIVASYDDTSVNQSSTVQVSNSIQFNITGISSAVLKYNETVSMDVTALDRGVKIPLNSTNFAVKVGSVLAPPSSISSVGDHFSVSVFAPDMSPDTYALVATLTHGSLTYTATQSVSYNVPIEGRITDYAGKGISTEINFRQNDVQKLKVNTDASGSYSSGLVPGDYEVEIKFPEATVLFDEIDIDTDYDDEINYYSIDSKKVDGLEVAAVHVFEISLGGGTAEMTLRYDEGEVADEGELKVYRCGSWNKVKNTCMSQWKEVSAFIDTVANEVEIDDSTTSAYAVGILNRLSMNVRLDDQDYPVGSKVKVSGVVVDKDGNTVGDGTVTVAVKGTGVSASTKVDPTGVFSMEFAAPGSEGNFTVVITASKDPFEPFSREARLEVVRNRVFTTVFPDTVKIEAGSEVSQNLRVVNTGQTDLSGLKISMSGIPGDYFVLPDVGGLRVGEERNIPITFSVPAGTEPGTHSVTMKIENAQVSREKVFGFTVAQPRDRTETDANTPITGLLIGFGSIKESQITTSLTYMIVFAACAFSASFLLKRMRLRGRHQNGEVRSALLDLKNQMSNRKQDPPPHQHSGAMWDGPQGGQAPRHPTETDPDKDRRERKW